VRAAVHDRYGPPEALRLEEVPRPAPAEHEVLVIVHATTVTRTDCHVLGARPFVWRLIMGLRRPRRRILGLEFAGKIVELGAAGHDFEIGDAVFGITGLAFGAHAEYVCIAASGPIAIKPRGVGFDVAAASLDGSTDALAKLRRAGVSSGQRVLVYGASGSIGTAAVQLAKLLAPRSRRSAIRTILSSSVHLAPIRSLTTRARTSRPAARPTTSYSMLSARSHTSAAGRR
jgi:NADPH:quinone reductase-like Zn-dependent oxidoreductase